MKTDFLQPKEKSIFKQRLASHSREKQIFASKINNPHRYAKIRKILCSTPAWKSMLFTCCYDEETGLLRTAGRRVHEGTPKQRNLSKARRSNRFLYLRGHWAQLLTLWCREPPRRWQQSEWFQSQLRLTHTEIVQGREQRTVHCSPFFHSVVQYNQHHTWKKW